MMYLYEKHNIIQSWVRVLKVKLSLFALKKKMYSDMVTIECVRLIIIGWWYRL